MPTRRILDYLFWAGTLGYHRHYAAQAKTIAASQWALFLSPQNAEETETIIKKKRSEFQYKL